MEFNEYTALLAYSMKMEKKINHDFVGIPSSTGFGNNFIIIS